MKISKKQQRTLTFIIFAWLLCLTGFTATNAIKEQGITDTPVWQLKDQLCSHSNTKCTEFCNENDMYYLEQTTCYHRIDIIKSQNGIRKWPEKNYDMEQLTL